MVILAFGPMNTIEGWPCFGQVLLADFLTGYTRISSCAGQGA